MAVSASERHVKISVETGGESKPCSKSMKAKTVCMVVKKLKKKEKRAQASIAAAHHVDEPSQEDLLRLRQTARALVKPGVGILAADETLRQIDAKLKELKLLNTDHNRRKIFEVFLGGSLELEAFLSGVLIREEIIGHTLHRGKKVTHMIKERKLKLGIRLDRGVVPLAGTRGEYTTWGLDKLEDDCKRIREMGAEFALWRCVYRISSTTPSRLAIQENSTTLARFAVVCQYHGLVPIVSAELLPEGRHDGRETQRVLKEILTELTRVLITSHVIMECVLIRVSAAAPGHCYTGPQDMWHVSAGTAKMLNQCLPPAVGGVLLAREHSLSRSLAILNDIQNCPIRKPFFLSFCFSQVIQDGVIAMWAGQDKNLDKARSELMRRLKCCGLATFGQCSSEHTSLFTKTSFNY